MIRSAAAKVPAQPAADFLGSRIGMLIEKRFEGDDESGRAEAALRSIVVDECLLDRMKFFALHEGFDCGDCLTLRLNRQNRASVDRAIVEKHRAGAAFAAVTHALGARYIQLIAEGVEQGNPGLNLQCMFLAVDRRARQALCRGHKPSPVDRRLAQLSSQAIGTAAAEMVEIFRKSRRETPELSATFSSESSFSGSRSCIRISWTATNKQENNQIGVKLADCRFSV